jgi:hypothetical protein
VGREGGKRGWKERVEERVEEKWRWWEEGGREVEVVGLGRNARGDRKQKRHKRSSQAVRRVWVCWNTG